MEPDDCFFLPRLQPEITGNPTVVLVDAPVNAVTPEQISSVAKKYLTADQMKVVVVGDKEKIADQLTPYESAGSQ